MKCYFCRNDIKMLEDKSAGPYRVRISETCPHCAGPNKLHEVCTTIDENGEFEYAHIYPDKQEYYTIFGAPNIPGSSIHVPTNVTYHIRLNIKENTTYIGVNTTIKDLLNLPGLPIKPSNAREKLKLYLLFS
jgi:hypothetical protein